MITAGCHRAPRPVPIDLLDELPRAERRPAGPDANQVEHVHAEIVSINGDTRPALVMVAPARATWSVKLAGMHAMLRTAVTLMPAAEPGPAGAAWRIGIADNRSYDELMNRPLHRPGSAWQPIELDLSAYSGWRFSLFYQPDRRTWKLIFNADAVPRGTIAWAQPVIDVR
jgi:hypothetical protein